MDMFMDKFEPSIQIFKKNHNTLRMVEAVRKGVPRHFIYEMVSAGILAREERGLYRLADAELFSNPDLVNISLLVPKAVICLISALYFYELTTQVPHAVWIALPRNIRTPRLEYPPIEVVRLSQKPYQAGIEELFIDGKKVPIYSPEKTITDCFKFRNLIGKDIAIEALKDYMRRSHPKIDQLIEFAQVNRVENIIRPYLEILVT
jgi:predicted transcriptional regulator of viral defense system